MLNLLSKFVGVASRLTFWFDGNVTDKKKKVYASGFADHPDLLYLFAYRCDDVFDSVA